MFDWYSEMSIKVNFHLILRSSNPSPIWNVIKKVEKTSPKIKSTFSIFMLKLLAIIISCVSTHSYSANIKLNLKNTYTYSYHVNIVQFFDAFFLYKPVQTFFLKNLLVQLKEVNTPPLKMSLSLSIC
ncbi:hypothetical protein T190115A13A_90146 [Tenacibaculum sp. 190524A02b]|uniref:Uncharacterized protein n=1 Tax=Tenacibaculum vairaonense TaxID=3137860 RepID=A0ABM9PSI9_9FLAO